MQIWCLSVKTSGFGEFASLESLIQEANLHPLDSRAYGLSGKFSGVACSSNEEILDLQRKEEVGSALEALPVGALPSAHGGIALAVSVSLHALLLHMVDIRTVPGNGVGRKAGQTVFNQQDMSIR